MQRKHIGFSSFAAPLVRQRFYPDTPTEGLLDAYAQRFGCYEMPWTQAPKPGQVAAFIDQAPPGLTLLPVHPGRGAQGWTDEVSPLLHTRQCGPVLVPWSEPWSPRSALSLEATLDNLWDGMTSAGRVAVEFSHPSWFRTDALRMLQEHETALVWSTRAGIAPHRVTADFLYVRLTGRAVRGGDEVAALLDRIRTRIDPRDRFVVGSQPQHPHGIHALERMARRLGVPIGAMPHVRQSGLERYAATVSS